MTTTRSTPRTKPAQQAGGFFARLNSTQIVYLVALLVLVAGSILVATTGRNFFSPGHISAILIGAGVMANQSGNVPAAVALALGVSAVIGLANGLIVAGLKVHGFIATLGMGLIISGYLGTNFKGSYGQTPFSFRLIGATGLGPVPISTLIMLACAALVLAPCMQSSYCF